MQLGLKILFFEVIPCIIRENKDTMAFLYGVAFILCCGLQGVLLVTNPVRIVKRLARFGNDNQGHGKWSTYLCIYLLLTM